MGTSAHKVKQIFLHCSATPWGDVIEFDQWHKKRGWKGVGYHYIILNGRPFRDVSYWRFLDGQIQPGRPLDDDPIFEPHEVGTHVAGRNGISIGVCLVGKKEFTDKQLLTAKDLITDLVAHFGLCTADVLGHYEHTSVGRTCPNIPMDSFRSFLNGDADCSLEELQKAIIKHTEGIYGK